MAHDLGHHGSRAYLTHETKSKIPFHFFTGKYIQQSLSDSNFGSRDANFVYTQLTVNF